MKYKLLRTDDLTNKKIYEKIEDDGKSYSSCTEDNQDFVDWVAEGNTPDDADSVDGWIAIRTKRDQILRDTDWTMTTGATVDQAQWAAYRQVIRDIPQTYKDKTPDDVVWPTQPSTAGPNTYVRRLLPVK